MYILESERCKTKTEQTEPKKLGWIKGWDKRIAENKNETTRNETKSSKSFNISRYSG